MPIFNKSKLQVPLLAPGVYAVQLGKIERQYSGGIEIWRVPCADHTGRVLTTTTIKIDPQDENPWKFRSLVNHSGVATPEGDFAVEPRDFEGLLMYINVRHNPGNVDSRIFVNVSFVSRDWAVQQNSELGTAPELFKNARTPGTFQQATPTLTASKPAPGGASRSESRSESRSIESVPPPPPIQDPDEISPAEYDQAIAYAKSLKNGTAPA
jgi:hypothetical protein